MLYGHLVDTRYVSFKHRAYDTRARSHGGGAKHQYHTWLSFAGNSSKELFVGDICITVGILEKWIDHDGSKLL